MISKKVMKNIFKEIISSYKNLQKDKTFSMFYKDLFMIEYIEYFVHKGYFNFDSFFVAPTKVAIQYEMNPLTEKGLDEYYRLFKFKKFLSKFIDNYV